MDLQPAIICLQEKFLKANDNIKIKILKNYHSTSLPDSGVSQSYFKIIYLKQNQLQSVITVKLGL